MPFLRHTSLEKSGMSGIRDILEVCCEKREYQQFAGNCEKSIKTIDGRKKKCIMEKIEKETVKSM